MKDLYRRLGIEPYANRPDAIQRAISRQEDDKATARAASHILLVNRRKRVYDRTHRALTGVGQLRANLGLTLGEGWLASKASDFDFLPNDSITELDRLRETKKAKFLRDNIRGLKATGVGAGILVLIFVVALSLSGNSVKERSDSGEGAIASPGMLGNSEVSAGDGTQTRGWPGVSSLQDESDLPSSEVVDADSTPPQDGEEQRRVVAKPPSGFPPLPLPSTGAAWFSNDYIFARKEAPLKIVTPADAGHYLVKLTESRSGKEVVRFFIREGKTLEVKMPEGTFELRYANGEQWYGYKHLFGTQTSCARADDTFEFYIDDDEAVGHEIELISQLNGNLETEPISVEEF